MAHKLSKRWISYITVEYGQMVVEQRPQIWHHE